MLYRAISKPLPDPFEINVYTCEFNDLNVRPEYYMAQENENWRRRTGRDFSDYDEAEDDDDYDYDHDDADEVPPPPYDFTNKTWIMTYSYETQALQRISEKMSITGRNIRGDCVVITNIFSNWGEGEDDP